MLNDNICIRSGTFSAELFLPCIDQLPLRNWGKLSKMLQETWYPENEQTRKRLDIWFPEQIRIAQEDIVSKDKLRETGTKSTKGIHGAALKAIKSYNHSLVWAVAEAKKKHEKLKKMYLFTKENNKMPITINDVRFSYCNLFQPKPPINNPAGEAKYSTTILIPKTNAAAKAAIDQAIAQAIEEGVASKWNGVRPPVPAVPIHDGDGPRPSDGQPYGEECRGCWVLTAGSKNPPFVVDSQVQNIIDPTQVYSGMWGNVNVNFFAYNSAGKKGIGCGLNGVQKTRDGEPLTSRVTAQEAFQPVAVPATPEYGAAMPATYGAGPGYPSYPQQTPAYPTQPQTPVYPGPAAQPYPPQPQAVPAYYPQQPQVNPATGEVYTPAGMNIFGLGG